MMHARSEFWLSCGVRDETLFHHAFGELHLDSRQIQAGDVFIALRGFERDGRDYIPAAIAAGAKAIVEEGDSVSCHEQNGCFRIVAPQLKSRLSELAACYYHHPSQHLHLHAVTGTNGKTSCSHFLAQALSLLNHQTATIGTLGYGRLQALQPLANTTPDAVSLQRILAECQQQGVTHVTLEASSIALVQDRLAACRLESAIFTNLTRDHLDYHGTMAEYGAAKAKLFAWPSLQRAVVNDADPFSPHCVHMLPSHVPVYRYNRMAKTSQPLILSATVQPPDPGQWGLSARWYYQGQSIDVRSSLIGAFNMENLLSVAAVLLDLGVAFAQLPELIAQIEAVPGRLHSIKMAAGPRVVVDYAHTPDALKQVLAGLKPYAGQKLWCIVGCGGNRDPGKRPLMAQVASQGADFTVLTDDNPRFEASQDILNQMAAGLPQDAAYAMIADRKTAIETVLQRADTNDIVLIAGKGHENYQQIGAVKHPFDDAQVAQEYLKTR